MDDNAFVGKFLSGEDVDQEFEGDAFKPAYVAAGTLPGFGKLPGVPFTVEPDSDAPGS
jgi:hypothetical protein